MLTNKGFKKQKSILMLLHILDASFDQHWKIVVHSSSSSSNSYIYICVNLGKNHTIIPLIPGLCMFAGMSPGMRTVLFISGLLKVKTYVVCIVM